MPRRQTDFGIISKIALSLDGAEEVASWGAPAFKVCGKMFACVPTNKQAEPGSLGIRIDFERRAELLAEAPEIYYAPDHYRNYPMLLLRLARIDADALLDLLSGAHRPVGAHRLVRPRKKSA